MTFPQRLYLGILFAEGHPKQEPEYRYATWWHVLWMLVPVIGILLFTESVKRSAA